MNHFYTVFSRDLQIKQDGVSLFTKDVRSFSTEKGALIEAIICNFEYIEENDPFYDPYPSDQYFNNYFFCDTPKAQLLKYDLDWCDPQSLNSFDKIQILDLNSLYDILYIQKCIITPKCNKNSWLYSHRYTSLKKYNCRLLTQ